MLLRRVIMLLLSGSLLGSLAAPVWAAPSVATLRGQVKQIELSCQSRQWKKASKGIRKALESGVNQQPPLAAKVYLCLGQMLFAQKLKSLSWTAFQNALRRNGNSTLPTTASPSLLAFFQKVQIQIKEERAFFQGKGKTNPQPGPGPSPQAPVHIGWTLGWITGAVGVSLVLGGAVAGYNAYADGTYAFELKDKAEKQLYKDHLIRPTIEDVQQRAETHATVANTLYIAGGVLAAAGVGLIVWSLMAKPTNQQALLPSSTTPHTRKASANTSTPLGSPLLLMAE